VLFNIERFKRVDSYIFADNFEKSELILFYRDCHFTFNEKKKMNNEHVELKLVNK